MQRKTKLICKLIYKGRSKETEELIKRIDEWQIAQIKPRNYNEFDVDNYIKRMELSFENVCASMEDLGVKDPGRLTIFQFYTRIEYFEKKKLKQQSKQQHR
jgi:hypothetical protein